MWQMLDLHTLIGIYAAIILIPFSFAYFVGRIADWWRG